MATYEASMVAVNHDRFIAHADSNRLLDARWPGNEPWRDLVARAAVEVEDSRPVSAAVWEAMWRVDRGLAPLWIEEGPQVLGPTLGSPNPYLQRRGASERDWIDSVANVDLEAADLLATAVRAERVETWWSPEEVLRQHAAEWVGYEDVEATTGPAWGKLLERERPDGFAAFRGGARLLLEASDDPAERLDQIEEALTRLLLIGHRPTTEYLLPELLAFASAGNASGALELQELRTALKRFPRAQRIQVAVSTARVLTRKELAKRERPPQVMEFLDKANGGLRQVAAIVLVVAGGTALSSASRRRASGSFGPKEPG